MSDEDTEFQTKLYEDILKYYPLKDKLNLNFQPNMPVNSYIKYHTHPNFFKNKLIKLFNHW